MNQGSSSVADTERTLNPMKLLEQLATSQAKGCLRVVSNDITWLLYFYEGKLFYANHSLEPIERLEQHLRRISPTVLPNQFYTDLREQLKGSMEATYPSIDYQAIRWAIAQGHITEQTAAALVKSITKEVLQSYLLLKRTGVAGNGISDLVEWQFSVRYQRMPDRVTSVAGIAARYPIAVSTSLSGQCRASIADSRCQGKVEQNLDWI
jgi:hypothetical protein